MTVFQCNEGLDHLHHDRVWLADNTGFDNSRMLHQHALHFEGPNQVPGAIDDIVSPANEPEIAVLVHTGTIAGNVPTLAETRIVHLGVVPIRPEHRGPTRANRKISILTGAQRFVVVVQDRRFDAGDRLPH